MNLRKHLIWIGAALMMVSCGTDEALFQVDTFMDFRIPLGLNTIEAHYFVEQNVPLTLNTQLENLDIKPEEVTQVIADRATLYPRFNQSVSLDFIQEVNVYILEDINDLNSDTEIFFLDVVPPGNKSEIRLFSSISDVTDLLLNNTAIIAVRLEFRQFPPATFDMRLDMRFGVFVEE